MIRYATYTDTPRPCPKPEPRVKKEPTPIRKLSDEKRAEIKRSKMYYLEALVSNIKKNGKACCDECGMKIIRPNGSNVCHVIGKGADLRMYYEKTNNVILGKGWVGECNCKVKLTMRGSNQK